MSLMHEAIIAEKYGLRLTVEQLGHAFNLAPNTIHNRIAKGEMAIPSYVDGKKRFFDYRDVAVYLDQLSGRTQA